MRAPRTTFAAAACAALAGCVFVFGRDETSVHGPFIEELPETVERTHEPFTSVRVEGAVDLELRVVPPEPGSVAELASTAKPSDGAKPSDAAKPSDTAQLSNSAQPTDTGQRVRIQGDRGLLSLVTSEVKDGALVLRFAAGSGTFEHGPLAIVECPQLERLVHGGSGWVAVAGLDQPQLAVELTGSGDVLLRGKVGRLAATLAGLGALDVAQLEVGVIEVSGPEAARLRGARSAPGAH